jgi:hypothetical protein
MMVSSSEHYARWSSRARDVLCQATVHYLCSCGIRCVLLEMVFSMPSMQQLGNEDLPDQGSVVIQSKHSRVAAVNQNLLPLTNM